MTRTALLAILPLAFSGTAACAEATEDGAAHLLSVFQTYLGSTEGVVSVAVTDDSYTVTLDATPLSNMAADAGGTFSLTPQILTVIDNGDGTWGVSQDQSVTMTFGMPGQADITQEIGAMTYEGVFDEALMSFSSAKGEARDIRSTQKMIDPSAGEVTTETTLASMTFDLTGKAATVGGVDAVFAMAATGYSGTFNAPVSPEIPAMSITYTVDSLAQNGTTNGLRPDVIYKTLAWFVANQTDDAMQANKGALKAVLLEGLPIFDMTTGDITASGIKVASPMGEVGIAEAIVNVELGGAVPEGKLREAIAISGLTLPAGVVPEWAASILPQRIKFDFQITDFDARAGMTALLDLLDLPPDTAPDEAMNAKISAAFLPANSISLGLNPGFVAGDGYELTFEGDMVIPLDMPMPTGKALITLTGLDRLQAAIATAPEDVQGQAMMTLGMAQGMAKPGPNGELVWEIDASMPGTVSVNGMPMMGGP